jgi:hypothetical protein
MTHDELTLAHGDEYIVFYTGGPYDGRTDRRISTDGSWDTELTVLVALDGKETQVVYDSPVARTVGEQIQVTYSWDALDGEPLEALDERRD